MSSLKENNRWKIDSKEKKSFDQQKRKRVSRNNNYERNQANSKKSIVKENLNVNDEDSFPSLISEESKKIDEELKSKYLEKIKIQKEIEEEKSKNTLKNGWIAYKMKKGTNKIQVSRNGIDYYDSLRETYTEEEWEEKERQEFNKEIKIMSYRLEELYLKRKKESDDYYYETGRLDSFAIAEKEREEYEEYLKKFEEDEEEESEESSDEDEDYISDDQYNKWR